MCEISILVVFTSSQLGSSHLISAPTRLYKSSPTTFHNSLQIAQKCLCILYLDQQSLDLVLDGVDLGLDGGSIVGGHRSSDNWSGDTTSSAQSGLGRNKHVWNVLVLAQQRQVQQDLDWLGVSSHDDELRDTSVQSLGGLVGTLLQLSQVLRLLDDIQDLLGQGRVGQREGFWVCGHF